MTATEQQDTITIEDALQITGLTHEAIRLACKKGAATGRPFHAWQPAPRQWAINRASFMEWWQNRQAPKGGRHGKDTRHYKGNPVLVSVEDERDRAGRESIGDNSTIVGTAPDPLTFDLPAEQPPPTAPDPAIYFDLPLMPATDNAPGALDAPPVEAWQTAMEYIPNPPAPFVSGVILDAPPVEVQGDNPTQASPVEVWQTADPSRCACPGCGHSRMTKHHYQNGRRRCPTCIIADCQPGAPRCATVPTEDLTMPEVD